MGTSTGLKFHCTFLGEDGSVKGDRVFNATEQPGNRVISFDTLVDEVSAASFSGGSFELCEGHVIKCGNIQIERDEDVNKIVANAVKYGQENVELVVDVAQRGEWELVETASQFSDQESTDNRVAEPAVCSSEATEVAVGALSEAEAAVTSYISSSNDVTGEGEMKDVLLETDERSITQDSEASVQVVEDRSPDRADSFMEASESAAPRTGGKDELEKSLNDASNTQNADLALEDAQNFSKKPEESKDKKEEGREVDDYYPIATLGNFATSDAMSDTLFRDQGTSQPETLSEWTSPSNGYKAQSRGTALSLPDCDTDSVQDGSRADTTFRLDVVDTALRDVERALQFEGAPVDGAKIAALVSTFGLVVKELLKGSLPTNAHDTGLETEGMEDENEGEKSFFALLKEILREREVVEAFQTLLASSVIRDFVVDVSTNDVKDFEMLRGFILNHLGDVLPELGTLLRRVPRVLSLVPSFLAQLSELVASNPKTDNIEQQEVGAVHENIMCDGCEQSESNKEASRVNGHISGAYILGVRYKSAIKPDFDLCESCEATGEFEGEYGPFLKIVNPSKAPREIVCILPAQEGQREVTFREGEPQEQLPRPTQIPRRSGGLVCPEKQHPLRRFHVPNRLFACDVCDSRPEKGSVMFGCRVCDWDMCESCARRNCFGRLPVEETSGVGGGRDDGAFGANAAPAGNRARPHPAPKPARIHRAVGCARRSAERNEAEDWQPRARFVADVSIPDGSVLSPGASFTKIWRVMNGSEHLPWPNGCRIVCVGGDMMGGNPEGVLVPPLPPGEVGDICVQLQAPTRPGRCFGYWRLITPSTNERPGGKRFGQRLWIDFTVADRTNGRNPGGRANTGVCPAPRDDLSQKWKEELRRLAEMQFLNIERNITLLEEEDGNLTKVIERLV